MHDENKVSMIRDALEKFASGSLDLDPKDCEHFEGRVKIAIDNAGVVVYYDLQDNDMVMISGNIIHKRVA